MSNSQTELIIENNSSSLELEQKLVGFVEQELNAVLIDRKAWICELRNSSSLDDIKAEIMSLTREEPGCVILWIRQTSRFFKKERWLKWSNKCDLTQEHRIEKTDIIKRFHLA